MQTTTQQNLETERIGHPISKEDKPAMTAMRAIVEPQKGRLQGTDARGAFDAIMSRVVAPVGVTFAPDTVGGVAGWWCRPERSRTGQAILHLHGGWFNWGSAQAFRNLVGHIAACAGVEAFVPDYRLAPEHRFPAATEDVRACYLGLIDLARFLGSSDYGRLGRRQFSPGTSAFCFGPESVGQCASSGRSGAFAGHRPGPHGTKLGDTCLSRSLFRPFAGGRARTFLSRRS